MKSKSECESISTSEARTEAGTESESEVGKGWVIDLIDGWMDNDRYWIGIFDKLIRAVRS